MAQLFCTGPLSVFVDVNRTGSPLFLGHSERTPNIEVRPMFSDVHSDITGQQNPIDKQYQGENGLVSLDLVRFNYSVYQQMADRISLVGSFPGTDGPLSIGTLMQTEGVCYNLFLRFPYAAKTAFGTLIPGYRFLQAFLMGPDAITSGTVPHKIRCVWYCMPQFAVSTGAVGPTLALYDYLFFGTLPSIN